MLLVPQKVQLVFGGDAPKKLTGLLANPLPVFDKARQPIDPITPLRRSDAAKTDRGSPYLYDGITHELLHYIYRLFPVNVVLN